MLDKNILCAKEMGGDMYTNICTSLKQEEILSLVANKILGLNINLK